MRRHVLAAVACVVALAACEVDATVTVRMRENGSGTVRVRVALDPAAVRAAEVAGGKLEERVRLDDLSGAGWTVTPWQRDARGGATLTVRKPFPTPREVARILGEISGPDGPVRSVALTRRTSTFATRWQFRGAVDLRSLRLGVGSDSQLVANLTAVRVDIPQVESRIASGLGRLRVHLVADLPDGVRREASARVGTRAVLHATSARTDVNRVVMLGGGVAAAALAVVLLVFGEVRSRRRRHRARAVGSVTAPSHPRGDS